MTEAAGNMENRADETQHDGPQQDGAAHDLG